MGVRFGLGQGVRIYGSRFKVYGHRVGFGGEEKGDLF